MRTLLAVAALAIGAVASASPLMTAAAAVTPTVVFGDNGSINWHDADVRPPGFILGQMYITKLTWSHWGKLNASATGIIHVCASSSGCTRHSGTMYLHQVRTHRGREYFREMTLRWRHHVERVTYSRDGGTAVFWH